MLENDLKQNIDRIHTTLMGAERISRNLQISTDPVDWCKTQIEKSTDIIRKGKNWYVKADGALITVNAHNYTIITAHKDKAKD